MKTKFITAIYSDLYGTEFGGRIGRRDHYRYSLLSLLKMTNADFVCYTSEREFDDLNTFFYQTHNISRDKLSILLFNLTETKFFPLIREYKDLEASKQSDRCIEIQYCKFEWLENNLDNSYEYTYWIDAGLSHCGLIPTKYRSTQLGHRGYFESSLFNNNFLNNLNAFTQDKIFLIGKENSRNYWDGTVNMKHYKKYDSSYHIIGGLFGGHKTYIRDFINFFNGNVYNVTKEDSRLYHEEHIMGLIWRNNEEIFNVKLFDTWWHENMSIAGINIEEHVNANKSFYKILEELNH